MTSMAEAIRELIDEKGYTKESVKEIISSTLKAAYKRTYGTDENALVKFNDDLSDVALYSRKVVTDGVYDPVREIELEEAKKLSSDCEEGDEIDLLIDPMDFDRPAVSAGKQNAKTELQETMQDRLYEEYKDKIGKMVTGTFLRLHNNVAYVDMGKVEGIIPKRFQSPREMFEVGDRIKAYCVDARKSNIGGLQLILSRTDKAIVRAIMEMEVPEIADGTIEIVEIVREAGYRSKVAVRTTREDVDPVGSCVGQKGVRVQSIITALKGERVDVLKYSEDELEYIKNCLSPSTVDRVVITDPAMKKALAIVPDTQFSLAIGKQGMNVRLANRLCGWVIDVKSASQCADMDLSMYDNSRAAESLFSNTKEDSKEVLGLKEQLPDLDLRVVSMLHEAGIDDIDHYKSAKAEGSVDNIIGITSVDIDNIDRLVALSESAKDSESKAMEEEEEYFCPECGAKITLDMTRCPNCGVEFTFEEDED